MREKWQEIVSKYEASEDMSYAENVQASVAINDELQGFLTVLESENHQTKLSVLMAICASPYFYRALDSVRPPAAVAYTLISKGLYEEGMCETPDRFLEEVEYLTDELEDVQVPGGVGRHRLAVLKNRYLDPKILEDEFDTTNGGDLEVVEAVLGNPISPERLLKRIFESDFDSVDDHDGYYVLMDLIKHPGTPRDVLEKIVAGDHDWEMGGDQDALEEITLAAQARLVQQQ